MNVCQEKALELKGLSINYGPVPALRHVSLHVNAGEIATLLGANGAGKTTTLKAIYGLIPILEGEVLFFGDPLRGRAINVGRGKGTDVEPEAASPG